MKGNQAKPQQKKYKAKPELWVWNLRVKWGSTAKIMLGLCNLRSLEMAATNLHRPKRMNPFTDGKAYYVAWRFSFSAIAKNRDIFFGLCQTNTPKLSILDLQNHGGRYVFCGVSLGALPIQKPRSTGSRLWSLPVRGASATAPIACLNPEAQKQKCLEDHPSGFKWLGYIYIYNPHL